MIKIVCFGVRETEVPYFNKLNEKFGYELKLVTSGLTHENVEEAIGAEAIMVRGDCKADRRNLEILKNNGLKYVLTRTVGFDHVDLEAVKEFGLESARVPGYSPNAISELAVSLAMMLLRHTAYTVNRTRERNFTIDAEMFSKEIRNCTVGVLGTGKIGLTTAKLFKGLGAKVLGYDVFQSDAAKEVVEFKSLDEVIAESDVISIHMPFFKDLSGAPLENPVFEKLVNLYPKVLVTPHMGSYTDEALVNMIEISYENLKEYLNEGTCKNKIA